MKKSKTVRLLLPPITFFLVLASPVLGSSGSEYESERMVCRMKPGYSISYINLTYGTEVLSIIPETGAYLLATPSGADAESLAAVIRYEAEVIYCIPNYYVDAPEPFQRSSPFLDNQHTVDFGDQAAAVTLDLGTAHEISTGDAVRVAIIDTGLNFEHPQFTARSRYLVSGYDFVDDDTLAVDEPGGVASGHGTFVAGLVSLAAPDAHLVAYRVLDTLGRGSGYQVAQAVVQAVRDSCKIINLSLGMRGMHNGIEGALQFAHDNRAIVIAAAGNDSSGSPLTFPFPANHSHTLAVAALDSLNFKADFSNWGGAVDFCAPGTQLYAPFLDTSYAWWDGTSFSAPLVSGTAALLCAVEPSLTREQIFGLLAATSADIDTINPLYAGGLGHGIINPGAALQLLTNYECGDVDRSGAVTISDVLFLLNYLFGLGPAPVPLAAGDCDCSGFVTVSDAVYLTNFIFAGGGAPCAGCP